jgi:AmmeMemoRadiSam system protein B
MEELFSGAKKIRSPVVGGLFYPEEETGVLDRLASYGLRRENGGRSAVIIAPHGAWDISGKVAAAAFSAASGSCGAEKTKALSQVVILGLIHQDNAGGIFLSESDSFMTPLGSLPVNQRLCGAILSCDRLFERNDIPHLREHSIEVLLPFIKYCFPQVSIVPILMGKGDDVSISALARVLRIVFEPLMEDTLLVVSCNLSMNNNEALARVQAEECVRLLLEKNSAAFSAGVLGGKLSACGGALAAGLLESGLVDKLEARFVSEPLICAKGEENKTVYYGAVSYSRAK